MIDIAVTVFEIDMIVTGSDLTMIDIYMTVTDISVIDIVIEKTEQ